MAARVTVERDGEGRLVVRKEASGADGGELAAEAGWLRRAAGPGVARLLDDDPAGPPSGRLTTLHAGAHTWRTARLEPGRAGAVAGGVLRTVARLHRGGLVHGALGPDHVLLGPHGPVLCSPRPGPDDPGEDRAALAELLATTAERWRDEGRPIPDGWQRAVELLGRPTAGWALDDIAALVDPAPATPPTAARRSWPGSPRPARRTRPLGQPRAGRTAAIGVLAALAALVAGVALSGPLGSTTAGAPLASAPADPPGHPAPASGAPGHPAPASTATGPERTEWTGPVAEGRARYRVDDGEGSLVTAPRPCPGTPPAALLEPGTGRVWAFLTLPVSGGTVSGVAVQRSPGAQRLVLRPDGDCQRIVAVGPAGEAPVPAAAPQPDG